MEHLLLKFLDLGEKKWKKKNCEYLLNIVLNSLISISANTLVGKMTTSMKLFSGESGHI